MPEVELTERDLMPRKSPDAIPATMKVNFLSTGLLALVASSYGGSKSEGSRR
jgi:hypothetical protein